MIKEHLIARQNSSTASNAAAEQKKSLRLMDAVALIVGVVVGAGIFRTPSLVAANSTSEIMFLMVWVAGGVISLIGALCYAELASAFPHTGGDYHFLQRAFGKELAFLFGWARMTVIQTGSVALLAYIFADYLTEIYNLGNVSTMLYAAGITIMLTLINILGVKFGSGTQKLLTTLEVSGVGLVIIAGLFFAPAETTATLDTSSAGNSATSLGLAMVIVLLTFGGWNEAAYLSAELKSGSKQIVKALMIGIVAITFIYLLINLAYLNVLGLTGMAGSTAVGSDAMQLAFGRTGVIIIGALVALSALTSVNATIFTGARTNYAMGRDFKIFGSLGKWDYTRSAPVNAFLVQGAISVALICLGFFTMDAFQTIVEYTAPVFWFFFLLVGIALFVLRMKEPEVNRPFRVPFYPLIPLLFCLTSAYLLYSSIVYTGFGALVGVGVLGAGALLLLIIRITRKRASEKQAPALVSPLTVRDSDKNKI